MTRALGIATWFLFAAMMYLITAEALGPWLTLPGLGNVGFTLVFVLFAVLHCCRCEGGLRTGLFFASAAIISYLFEEIGVRTGVIYGPYHYSDMLGLKLGHVPILIPLAWFMMIYPSWRVAGALLRPVQTDSLVGIVARALIGAMVMTAWDTVMDPGMAAAGNWVWENGGPYFGVPLRNYVGWLLTTFTVYLSAGVILAPGKARVPGATPASPVTRGFAALPIIVYAWFALRYVCAGRIPALHVVALFAMGFPALLALIVTYLPEKHGVGRARDLGARDAAIRENLCK